MQFISVLIEGFRSFNKRSVFLLEDREAGFYRLRGENKAEPTLGENGAGKSTVLEALFWCLYGKTSRNLKAGTIGNWQGGKCSVVTAFEKGDNHYVLRRSWSPVALTLATNQGKPEEVDQQRVEQLIGMGPEEFLYSIYFAQFVPSFLDLSPLNKMAVFSSVMRLDEWEGASDTAAQESKALDATVRKGENDLSQFVGGLNVLREQQIQREEEELDFYRVRYHAALAIRNTIQDTKHRLAALKSDLIEEEKTVKETDSGDIGIKEVEVKSLINSVEKDIRELDRRIAEVAAEQRLMAGTSDKLMRSAGGECPVCRQLISAQHARREAAKMKDRRAVLESKINALTRKQQKKKQERDRYNQQLEDFRIAGRKAVHGEGKAEARIAELRQYIKDSSERIIAQRAQMKKTAQMKWKDPYGTEDSLIEMEERYKRSAEKLDITKREQADSQYWVKGFKDVRLYLISECLTQLEVEVNSYLVQLGLTDWQIEFSVESENKSGTVHRGFAVNITAPHSKESVPWEAWSGGESQRLRLAVACGLSNLIQARRGVTCNVEFWDEPSTWLSEAGIRDLMGFFAQRAQDQKKQIWIADHRSLNFGAFSGSICIIKDETGSRIEDGD
jgi:DNA repair exonuclease SbcCD ATPase subunit